MDFTTVNGVEFQVSPEDEDLVREHLTGGCAWRGYEDHHTGNWYILRSETTSEWKARGGTQANKIYLARVIAARMGLDLTHPHNKVDHINRVTTDNQRYNLRAATYSQNAMNRKKSATGPSGLTPSSPYLGVCYYKQTDKWMSRVRLEGKLHHLGYFDTEVEAAQAYDQFVREHFGAFAHLNFPSKP